MSLSPPRRDRRGTKKNEPAAAIPPVRTRTLPMRRTALVRTVVWVAVAAGPLALVASCARPDAVVRTQPAPAPRAGDEKMPAADPAGYAELFLDLWLRSGSDEQSAAAQQLRTMAPSIRPPSFGKATPVVERLAAVRRVPQGGSAWSVTVAVRFKAPAKSTEAEASGAVRYFALPLVVKDAGKGPGTAQGFIVPTAPMEVAAPGAMDEPDSAYGTQLPDESDLAVTAGEFLGAYLGAEEGADRYLAPGVTLPALGGSPFEAVQVDEVRAQGSTDGTAGADGTSVRVLVQATARDTSGGEWPLSYALKLSSRDGRWEVTALQSGLEDTGSTKPSGTHTSPTTATGTARRDTPAQLTTVAVDARTAGWKVSR
ncbi:conjugal transfer protein [Streptomyces sp. NPDC058268]|uniref:conjugal transfer protein n=2 Tax=unclassified Streptomyces TaxID=2593676 RepID=UPI0036ECBAF9